MSFLMTAWIDWISHLGEVGWTHYRLDQFANYCRGAASTLLATINNLSLCFYHASMLYLVFKISHDQSHGAKRNNSRTVKF